MKLVIAGLLSLYIFGCANSAVAPVSANSERPKADWTALPESALKLNLGGLEKNPDYARNAEGVFQYKSPETDLRIRRTQFANRSQAEFYLQNRKMLLDQVFKNNIAPYFGVIEINPTCYSMAQTEAHETKTNSMNTFFMEFPMLNRQTISDCVVGQVEGIMRYEFFFCRKQRTVFELMHFRKIAEPAARFEPVCG